MASRTHFAAFLLIASSVLLGSCAGALLQAEPAPTAASKRAPPTTASTEGLPTARRSGAEACVREGEACTANGPACCAGFICVGSRGSFCMPRH